MEIHETTTKTTIPKKLIKKTAKCVGYHFARGVGKYIWQIAVAILLINILSALFSHTDSTDKSYWHRSGLTVHTDAVTGVQYLSDGHGGMCIRVTSEGTPYQGK